MDLTNNIVLHSKGRETEYLQFKKLLKYSNIIKHGYSVGLNKDFRTCKPNKEKLDKEVYLRNLNNYKNLCEEIELDYTNIVKAKQAHTDNVATINNIEKNEIIDTFNCVDGLITDKSNIILATTNADCILLLMFDPVKRVIANVHSGWKGTLQEISAKTVRKMKNEYSSKPEDIIVCVCPSIRKCHFEVGKDVKDLFYNKFKKLGNIDSFIIEEKEKYYVDTVLINKLILKDEGVLEENIEDCGICSVCNKDIIHSFRAEGENYGLATALISLI